MNTELQITNSNTELVVETTALEQMERASIDVQIATAKRYPRQLSVVKSQMLSFATLDQETAAGCFFTLPARKGGDGKPIQGPSIRMAEIAISTFQNLRAGARIISDDGKVITAQGVCHDLQNNVCISVEVKRRVTTKDGRRYSDDMVVMTGNAACSIALRNATFRVVPLALVKPIYEAAKKVAVGDAKTLVYRRADCIAHFSKMGVAKEKVFSALGVNAAEDISLEHLEVLIGYANAIKDGDTSIDEVFNSSEPAKTSKTAKEMFKKKDEPEDNVPMEKTPASVNPKLELLGKTMEENGIVFDEVCDYCRTNNISADSGSWGSIEDISGAALDKITETKVLAAIVRVFGKK